MSKSLKPEIVLLKRKENIMGEVKQRRLQKSQLIEQGKQLHKMQVRPPGCFAGNYAIGGHLEMNMRENILEDEQFQQMQGLLFVIQVPGVRRTPQIQRIFKALGLSERKRICAVWSSPIVCRILGLLGKVLLWGEAKEDILQQLLFKTGISRQNGEKLTDNSVIERHLQQYDVLCVQDISHELITHGKNFVQCRRFLGEFATLKSQRLDVDENEVPCVKPGYRGAFINEYVLSMI